MAVSGFVGRRTAGTAAKVGHIPTRALELEPSRRDLFLKCLRATGWAGGQDRVRHFLQHVFRVAARLAAVGVDRHGELLSWSGGWRKENREL